MRPFILTTGGQGVAAERCVPQCMAVHGISPKKRGGDDNMRGRHLGRFIADVCG